MHTKIINSNSFLFYCKFHQLHDQILHVTNDFVKQKLFMDRMVHYMPFGIKYFVILYYVICAAKSFHIKLLAVSGPLINLSLLNF